MTDDRIEALESKVESLLRNTSPNIADSIKEIFERLSELEKTVRSQSDEDEYDDYDDYPRGDDDYYDDDEQDDDDDEQDEPCDKCGK